jgi:hypothetical protein
MKAVSAALATHLAGPVTTLATCWRITRTAGMVFRFTDHDRDLVVDGEVYEASAAYSRTAISNAAGMGVDNLDVEGVFDSAAVTEEELRAGLFDQAEVRIFLVNWADPSMGILRLRRGWFGEVVLTEQGVFRTEPTGLSQALQQRIGELYSPECRADLGDHRCRVPVWPPVMARETAYGVGNHVRVATGSGSGSAAYENRLYRCVVAGITAALEAHRPSEGSADRRSIGESANAAGGYGGREGGGGISRASPLRRSQPRNIRRVLKMSATAAALSTTFKVGRYTCNITVPTLESGKVGSATFEWSPGMPTSGKPPA